MVVVGSAANSKQDFLATKVGENSVAIWGSVKKTLLKNYVSYE